MPAALAEARKNLDNPPRIYTRDRHRAARRQPRASSRPPCRRRSPRCKTKALARRVQGRQRRGHRRARRVQDVAGERPAAALERATSRIGADTLSKKLAADEMVDAAARPAARDRRGRSRAQNQAAFAETARSDRRRARRPPQVAATLAADHPPAEQAARDDAAELDSLRGVPRPRSTSSRSPPRRPRARRGDAAVPARDDVGVDGHAGPVRDGRRPRRTTT